LEPPGHHQLAPSNFALRLGLAASAMAAVLLELMLTRLFSASIGYHFAFMMVSLTMFGMTLGAIIAYTRISMDSQAIYKQLYICSCFFALCTPLVCLFQSIIGTMLSLLGPYGWIALSFIFFSIPFSFSGIVVCLCLSRFSPVGKLYSADLIAAGLACPLFVFGLSHLNAQTMVLLSGILASLAACLFRLAQGTSVAPEDALTANNPARKGNPAASRLSMSHLAASKLALLALVICLVSLALPLQKDSLIVAGTLERVKWSPIGRVAVTAVSAPIVTWSKVNDAASDGAVPQKGIYIDWGAMTVMIGGTASNAELKPLKEDITALGNYMRPDDSLFVIGVGGGRDVLTGLLFGQKHIDGLEVNPAIADMVKKQYADFNGHLATKPGVNIVNDEARNWLARSGQKYGLIQCSLVDTWAASSSGALMLTESVLYTKDAFALYLKHISDHGMLSFLRWCDENEPAQMLRLIVVAKAALLELGVQDPDQHMILVTAPYQEKGHFVGDLLVSLKPFSQDDVARLTTISEQRGYKILWVPGGAHVEPFATKIKGPLSKDEFIPTDDCPFFFMPFRSSGRISSLAEPAQEKGFTLLLFTLGLVSVLAMMTILLPTWKRMREHLGQPRHIVTSAVYFSCLGIAYMLVEIAMVQRLTIFLGNPAYGLSVVLFSLLLASGAGSYVADKMLEKQITERRLMLIVLPLSAVLIVLSAVLASPIATSMEAAELWPRIAVAVALISIPGFFMGWGFPLGMSLYTRTTEKAGAWYWAVNGSTSVFASVLSPILSILFGIQATQTAGAFLYLVALLTLL
jgi:hypothetical protein